MMVDMVDGDKYSFPECGGTSVGAVLMSEDLRHAFNVHCTVADENSDDKLALLLDKILHCSYSDVVQYISSQLSSSTDSCTTTTATTTTTTAAAAAAAAADDDDDVDDDKRPATAVTTSEAVPIKTQHNISVPSQINTTSTSVSSCSVLSCVSCHRRVIRDTNLMHCDMKRHSQSVISASLPPVKLQRITELSAVDLVCTAPVSTCHSSDGNSPSASANDDDDDEAKCKQADVPCGCEALLSSSIVQSSYRVFCKDCYKWRPVPASDCSMLPLNYHNSNFIFSSFSDFCLSIFSAVLVSLVSVQGWPLTAIMN